jgi:hypothetical protein
LNQEVSQYIKNAPEPYQEIMMQLRSLVHQCIPSVKESFKWSRPVFSTEKDFAYLKVAKSYVTLGFFRFENLNDQDGLLEGTGKDMRHIKIKHVKEINIDLLCTWFKAAAYSA